MRPQPPPATTIQPAGNDLAVMDKGQVAELLSTTPRHVERLVEEGRLGFSRVGRFIRFRSSDVASYLEQTHVSPRAGAR